VPQRIRDKRMCVQSTKPGQAWEELQQAGGAREDWNLAPALAGELGSVAVRRAVIVGKKKAASFGCACAH